MLENLVLLLAGLSYLTPLVQAIPLIENRAGSVCDSGIYGELTPHLTGYQPAQIFCSAVYPLSCTTKLAKRTALTSTTTTAKPSSTTTAQDAKSSAWSKCQQQDQNVISTLCSCIEQPLVSHYVCLSTHFTYLKIGLHNDHEVYNYNENHSCCLDSDHCKLTRVVSNALSDFLDYQVLYHNHYESR